jgi:hypothetical protein
MLPLCWRSGELTLASAKLRCPPNVVAKCLNPAFGIRPFAIFDRTESFEEEPERQLGNRFQKHLQKVHNCPARCNYLSAALAQTQYVGCEYQSFRAQLREFDRPRFGSQSPALRACPSSSDARAPLCGRRTHNPKWKGFHVALLMAPGIAQPVAHFVAQSAPQRTETHTYPP